MRMDKINEARKLTLDFASAIERIQDLDGSVEDLLVAMEKVIAEARKYRPDTYR